MRVDRILPLIAAVIVALAAPVMAGEAVKLRIEFPPDVRSLDPGAELDLVQVVGVDAAGARVSFGGRSVRLTVSAGEVRLVEAPFRYAFIAPATIDGPTPVTFTATFAEDPAVQGTARLDILPRGPYVRLSLDSPVARVEWGASALLTVHGENREGRLVPVVNDNVLVSVDGPGSVEFVRLGTYRYTAPAAPDPGARSDVQFVARLEHYDAVHGKASLALGALGLEVTPAVRLPAPAAAHPGASEGADETSADPPARSSQPAPASETKSATAPVTTPVSMRTPATGTPATGTPATGTPATGTPAADDDEPGARSSTKAEDRSKRAQRGEGEEAAPIVWPGGGLGVIAWRGRADLEKGTPMRLVKRQPEPGGVFETRDVEQRIRAVVLDSTVTEIIAEWRVGDSDDLVSPAPGKLRTLRDRRERQVVVLDVTPPENGDRLRVTVVLRRPTGDLREEFVVQRKPREERPRAGTKER